MRILIRTSRWAIWARRLGSFAFIVALIAIFMHRTQVIASDAFTLTLIIVSVLAPIAVICALIGFVRIWFTGDRGWMRSLIGLVTGGMAMIPLLYTIYYGATNPVTSYVSTDWDNPPQLVTQAAQNLHNTSSTAQIEAAFPNAVTRQYRLSQDRVFEASVDLVRSFGWRVDVERQPRGFGQPGQINAVETSLVGYESEVAIRITSQRDQVAVAVISASMYGQGDLGANGGRVERFLLALDDTVSEIELELNATEASVSEQDEEPAAEVQGVNDN